MDERRVIYSLGHSTHPIEKIIGLLKQHQIATLADIRAFPGSRRYPQFGRQALNDSLAEVDIEYVSMTALGGRRRSKTADSPHSAWTVSAFRAYADYADTEKFANALRELEDRASTARLAYMCSEGLWWRCHRRIVSDHLIVRGWQVNHIMPDGKLAEHKLPDFARIEDGVLIYDDRKK